MNTLKRIFSISIFFSLFILSSPLCSATMTHPDTSLPRPLDSYQDQHLSTVSEILTSRVKEEPFNLVATLIFFCAVIHTLLGNKIKKWAKKLEEKQNKKVVEQHANSDDVFELDFVHPVSFAAEIVYFLGEVEVIFGIWIIPLMFSIFMYYDWNTAIHYINNTNYNEAVFVIIIMSLAETRPIIQLVENTLSWIVNRLGDGSVKSWWISILLITPVLGSFITEPAAMTIAAVFLGKQFYQLNPPKKFAYATIGLLFVNISVGGTLTHFAAPPVLMVSQPWDWNTTFMFTNFGWKAVIGILLSTSLYYFLFRKEFAKLDSPKKLKDPKQSKVKSVPNWIVCVHVVVLAWTVVNAHSPAIVIGSFLLFMGFHQATAAHQDLIHLRAPILVGFFLCGLIVHGGLQRWWIAPILNSMGEGQIMGAALTLTAFNDNAIITYLSTFVPNFSDSMRYAIVSGAIAGGGLTVIANAPNPVGQLILQKYFGGGISPIGLLFAASIPTIIVSCCFIFLT